MNIISIRGACEHNLKNIDVDVPKNKFVVFTGVSGSGKSSLVFDTIYAEAFRRFIDASQAPIYVMGNSVWSRMSRPRFQSITGLPPALGLSQRQGVASKTSTVGTISGLSDLFRVYFAAFGNVFCKTCDIPLHAMDFPSLSKKVLETFVDQKLMFIATLAEKRKGSFSSEIEKFRELGFSKLRLNGDMFDLQNEDEKIKIDPKKLNTIEVIVDILTISSERTARIERAILKSLEYGHGILKLEADEKVFMFNTKSRCPQCGESAPKLDPRYFSHSSLGKCLHCDGTGAEKEGLPNDLFPCKYCHGTRLHQDKPIVRVCNRTFDEIHLMPLSNLKDFILKELDLDIAKDKSKIKVYSELVRMIKSMNHLNLNHLILNRAGNSLSPGDLQRLRLASMISNKLTGALYVIDEPCQGLTADEVKHLSNVFKKIVKDGASLISVEHHPSFLDQCEVLFLIGPGAGVHGGQVVSITTDHGLLKNFHEKSPSLPKKSMISAFPQIEEKISTRSKKSSKKKIDSVSLKVSPKLTQDSHITFSDIQVRSLKKEQIVIKQGVINIIRGKTGLGKSTFIDLCLVPALHSLGAKDTEDEEKRIHIPFKHFCKLHDHKDIIVNIACYVKPGTQIRSSKRSVASALEVVQPIRDLFASLPTSQLLGLSQSHFSWNSKLGRCERCEGRGYIELPQKYAQPVRVECELCLGAKLNSRSLLPRFKGYNLADVMNLSLDQALDAFENHNIIVNKISKACQFGLGYVQLGQGMDTLSGGELQRLTLTIELKRANLEGAWFVLMHPSTGLHAPDIVLLGELMQFMASRGATFVAVENREEFLPYGHHVIEF